MNKLLHDHLSLECSIQIISKCTAYAVTALCDEQVTAVRSCCADMLISKVIVWRSAKQVTIYK